MATSALVLHKGAVPVDEHALKKVLAPPPSGRWFPVSHSRVLDTVKSTLTDAGFEIQKLALGLSRDGHRFFGTLDLTTPVHTGVALAVGVRNSTDQTFPLGFCAGNRVFCCDNLAFHSELMVRKKHTINGERRFSTAISAAVSGLAVFKDQEHDRIQRFLTTELTEEQADSYILRAYEKNVFSIRDLPRVIHEWRNPSFEEFRPRTVWSLFNAVTTVLTERSVSSPNQFTAQTMRLNALLSGAKAPSITSV